MEPVREETHGYRLKSQFNYLLPKCYGRPSNYYYTAYCLPEYDIVYQQAMNDIHCFPENERYYFGEFNGSFQ